MCEIVMSCGEDTQRLAWVSAWVRCPLSRLVGLGLHKLLSIAASGLDAYSNLHVPFCHARVAELYGPTCRLIFAAVSARLSL